MLLPQLAELLSGQKIAAIILDPTYKVMTKSESAQGEVAALMNSIERLGMATGAAVIFGSHFSKGNQAGKESIDRISGSGVFARDPDAILTMTRHEEDNVFVFEPILRNCPPIDPFCVEWTWPLMRLAQGMDPTALKQLGGQSKKRVAMGDAIQVLPISAPVLKSEWVKLGVQSGISRSQMDGLIRDILVAKHPQIAIKNDLFVRKS